MHNCENVDIFEQLVMVFVVKNLIKTTKLVLEMTRSCVTYLLFYVGSSEVSGFLKKLCNFNHI